VVNTPFYIPSSGPGNKTTEADMKCLGVYCTAYNMHCTVVVLAAVFEVFTVAI